MPFTYLDEQAPAQQASPKFTYLDNGGRHDEKSQSLKEMAKGEFDSTQGIVDFAGNSILKSATGKGFEDRAREAIPENTGKESIPEMIGKNAQRAALETGGQALDMITSPLAALPFAGKAGEAIKGFRNNIAKAALSPEFAQDAADFKYGHDARRVMQAMPDVIGEDANSTKAALTAKTQETGQAIGKTIAESQKSSEPVGVTDQDVVGHIDDKIAELNKSDPKGNLRTIRALEAKKVALLNNFDANGNIVSPVEFEKMTPQQIFDYKEQKLGNIKYTGRQGVDESALNSSLQESRRNIVKKMNEHLPELEPLNQDYGDLKAAQDATDRIIFKGQKEGLSGLGIKHIITAGFNDPINRARFAQWMYSAPQAEQEVVFKVFPELWPKVEMAFGREAKLGFAGQAGSKVIPEASTAEAMSAEGGPAGQAQEPNPFGMTKPTAETEPGLENMPGKGSTSPTPENFDVSKNARESFKQYDQQKPELAEKWKNFGKASGAIVTGTAAALNSDKANAMSNIKKKVFEGQKFTGEASTYGWGEKGLNSTTADGEKFDSSKPFVAMSALPLGSTVEVKDLKTGKTVTLPVKDFGPGKRTHRVVDLSKGAWQQLGYNKAGLTRVTVTVKKVGTGRRYHGKY